MSIAVSASVRSFSLKSGLEPLDAADALAAHLEAAGHVPHVMRTIHGMSGLAMVHVRNDDGVDEVVLVCSGDAQATRDDVRRFLQSSVPAGRAHLCSVAQPEADLIALFDGGPIALLEQRLRSGAELDLNAELSGLSGIVDGVVPIFADVLGVNFDLADRGVFRQVDEVTMRSRPTRVDEQAVLADGSLFPLYTLVALGLIATEAALRQTPGVSFKFGRNQGAEWSDAKTVGEVSGFPAVMWRETFAVNLASKVRKRWFNGASDNVNDMWTMVSLRLAEDLSPVDEDLTPEQIVARCERLDKALALAGKQLALELETLGDGEQIMASIWSLVDGKMKLTRLMAEGSGQAEAMATQVIEKDLQQAECANLLMDVYVRRPPQMTRYDALQLIVQLPGTPVKVTVALPYVPGERVEFPLEPLLQIGVGVPDSYDHDRLSRAFFSNLPDSGIGGRVPRTLVSSLDEQIDIEVTAADASSTGEQSNLDLLRLATLAPYAAFILVASADGELEPKEVTAFAQAMGRVVDPALKAMMVTCPVSPGTATGLVAGDLGLSSRALAAFGVISSDADSGTESHEALVEVVMGVARAQGELRAAELAAVMMVRRLLDGGRSAAAGPDPFPPVELSEELEALLPKAMYASTAAFLLVAAADGELEPKEVEAFGEAIGMRTNQLLMHIEESSDMAVPERVHELVANTDLILESLRAVSKIFDQHPDGDAAREAFMNTARQVARAHGDIRPEEQNSLDKVERVLRGGRGGGGVLVLLILLVAVSVIGAVGAVIGWTLFG